MAAAIHGLPARQILQFIDYLDAHHVCIHGFLLMRHGRTVTEGYWAPFSAAQPHRMFSVSKSLTSLAIGILVGEGRITLDDKICAHFPEKLPAMVPSQLAKLTLRDMLRMSTCHAASTYRYSTDPDWVRTFFTTPPTQEPGFVFAYDTSSTHVLAALVEKLTGEQLLSFLQTRLLDQIGATDAKRWLTDPIGTTQGGSGLLLTLRDFAKVANFCMGDGLGIVPADYLRAATSKQIDTPLQHIPDERFGYGYQFWRTRQGFSLVGMGGQLGLCVPELGLVLCTIADTQLDPGSTRCLYDAFFQYIVPAVADDLPEDVTGNHELAERLANLKLPPTNNVTAYAVATADHYRFTPGNPLGIVALRLTPDTLWLDMGTGEQPLPLGFGDWARGTFPGSTEPCLTSAGWLSPGVLHMRCYVIGDTPCGTNLVLALGDHCVTLRAACVTELNTVGLCGIASGFSVNRI